MPLKELPRLQQGQQYSFLHLQVAGCLTLFLFYRNFHRYLVTIAVRSCILSGTYSLIPLNRDERPVPPPIVTTLITYPQF